MTINQIKEEKTALIKEMKKLETVVREDSEQSVLPEVKAEFRHGAGQRILEMIRRVEELSYIQKALTETDERKAIVVSIEDYKELKNSAKEVAEDNDRLLNVYNKIVAKYINLQAKIQLDEGAKTA